MKSRVMFFVVMVLTWLPVSGHAQTYCNGQNKYYNGVRAFPNGKPTRGPLGIWLYPDGSPAQNQYRKVIYPNGDLVWDLQKQALYPGGKILRDFMHRLFWPDGSQAAAPHSSCKLPTGELLPCNIAVGIGVDFGGLVMHLVLDFQLLEFETSEVVFYEGADRASYTLNMRTAEATEIRLVCRD